MPITPLTPDHAPDAARLHIAGQPGTFLTRLGPDVLTVFYRGLPQSPVGFGYVAGGKGQVARGRWQVASHKSQVTSSLAASTPATCKPANLQTCHLQPATISGFVSATTSVGRLFAEMGTKRIVQFLPPLLRRFARQPSLIVRSVQTVLYPFLVSDNESNHNQSSETQSTAELLSIMVEPDARSQGIGAQLLHALVDECKQQQIDFLDVTVDAQNAGARRFYERHGFIYERTFVLYGRDMCLYQLAIRDWRVEITSLEGAA